MKQQGTSGLAEGQVTLFIQNHQVHARKRQCYAPGFALTLFFLGMPADRDRSFRPIVTDDSGLS